MGKSEAIEKHYKATVREKEIVGSDFYIEESQGGFFIFGGLEAWIPLRVIRLMVAYLRKNGVEI